MQDPPITDYTETRPVSPSFSTAPGPYYGSHVYVYMVCGTPYANHMEYKVNCHLKGAPHPSSLIIHERC